MVERALACLPVRHVQAASDADVDESSWPGNIPAVRQLLEGTDFGSLTILVGENGSGKSTVIEAIALAFGLSAEGGSTGARHRTRQTESELWEAVTLRRDVGASRWGRFVGPGLYLLDEPESALSFTSSLALAGQLHQMADQEDVQVLVSTHSPILAAIPGARLLELGPWGMREVEYDDLQLVRDWRGFLEAPGRYLRHLIEYP